MYYYIDGPLDGGSPGQWSTHGGRRQGTPYLRIVCSIQSWIGAVRTAITSFIGGRGMMTWIGGGVDDGRPSCISQSDFGI
jgi:hypothetical protein